MNAEPAETAVALPEIAGYRVLRCLGEGGMAKVYLAIQLSLQREVAIKLLALENAVSDELAHRFEREARTIARLDHPHIVGIHEVGRSSTGLPYYTMPYLPNGDLGRRRLRGDSRAVLAVLRALLDALAYAHAHGVVHRDVKPDNVLFDKNDRPLLTDFGIALATATTDHDHRVTERGRTLGSSGYMSPEQARGSDVDARADLYSLGVVCHELLTGELPFHGSDALSMAMAHVEDPVPRLPAALAAWQPFLDRALAKSPNDRYQDASEMRAGLEAVERVLDAPPPATARGRLRPFLLASLLAAIALAAWWLQPAGAPSGESASPTVTPQENSAGAGLAAPTASTTDTATNGRSVETAATPPRPPPPAEPPPREAGALVQDPGGPRMAWFPPTIGTRSMPRGFALALHEVTRDEYAAFVRATGHASARCRDGSNPVAMLRSRDWRDPGFEQSGREPVVCIGADDATAYAGWVSRRTGARYRLPTRAQWLHVAATARTSGEACQLGNLYDGGARRLSLATRHDCDDGHAQLAPVGSYRASAYGVRDLVGNAREWLADCERRGTSACAERAIAGSSFRDGERKPLLPSDRTHDAGSGAPDIGFRLLREVDD